MMTKEQAESRQNADKKEGFRRFMQEPMARALISTLAPSENLEVLLEASFNSGFAAGSVSTTISLLEVLMEKDMRQGPPR